MKTRGNDLPTYKNIGQKSTWQYFDGFLAFLVLSNSAVTHTHARTHTPHTQLFNGLLSGTTRVGRYQKKHSPTHTRPDHRTSFIIFLHLQRSMASSLFSLRAWQSSRTTSLQVLFGLPLGLGPSTLLLPICRFMSPAKTTISSWGIQLTKWNTSQTQTDTNRQTNAGPQPIPTLV